MPDDALLGRLTEHAQLTAREEERRRVTEATRVREEAMFVSGYEAAKSRVILPILVRVRETGVGSIQNSDIPESHPFRLAFPRGWSLHFGADIPRRRVVVRRTAGEGEASSAGYPREIGRFALEDVTPTGIDGLVDRFVQDYLSDDQPLRP